MARKVFYSFHYKPDNWRVAKIRNIGVIEGNRPASDNDWESIVGGGDDKIKKWISEQMQGRSTTIVLIGTNTSGRKWINHEIVQSWDKGMGVLGIHIHNIENSKGEQCSKGSNPFEHVTHGLSGKKLSSIVMTYDPPRSTSSAVYNFIADNIEDWIEKAIEIRKNN